MYAFGSRLDLRFFQRLEFECLTCLYGFVSGISFWWVGFGVRDLDRFEELTGYDRDEYKVVGDFETGSQSFRVVSYRNGFGAAFGFDDGTVPALDGFNREVPVRNLYLSEDRRIFEEVDPHLYHRYDFTDLSAVKGIGRSSGVMWYESNLGDGLAAEEVKIFSNAENFDYGDSSLQDLEWVLTGLTGLDEDDIVIQEIKELAGIEDFKESRSL
jgi:hypothetical protein